MLIISIVRAFIWIPHEQCGKTVAGAEHRCRDGRYR